MLKAIAMLGVLAALGGGTYLTVQRVSCPLNAAPTDVASTGEPCTACCSDEAKAAEAVAVPCPAEGQTQDGTTTTASAAPAPAADAAPQPN
jgi:hypothetical protein